MLALLRAFVLGADISELLRRGALEALGVRLDCERDISAIRNPELDIPLTVNGMGHYALSVVALGKGPSCVGREPNLAASYFKWTP